MPNGKSYWNKWYFLVILFLVIQVAFYYFLTVQFR
jgi:hypothetical protein